METVEIVMDGPDWVAVRTFVTGLNPSETLSWFTDAGKLNRWWGEEAFIEPRPGGLYEVGWPKMDWIMRGTVALCTPSTLVYSWTWDHEPDQPARSVIVNVAPAEGGTELTITHGPYRPDESRRTSEDVDREDHRDGWLHFLPGLHEAIHAARGTGASVAPGQRPKARRA
jgi:hypothetical protein